MICVQSGGPFVIAGTVTSHGLSWHEKSKLNLTSLTDNSCPDLSGPRCLPPLYRFVLYVSRGNRCRRRRPASDRVYQAVCRRDSNSDPLCQSAYQIGGCMCFYSQAARRCVCRSEATRAFSLPIACKLTAKRDGR